MAKKTIENKDDKWLFTPNELSVLFGHSLSTFKKRSKMPDFPESCRKSHGQYDLRVYLKWALERFYSLDGLEMSMGEAKLRRETAKAKKEEITLGEMEEKLIPIERVVSGLSFIFTGMKQKLMSWYKSLPPLLIGLEEKEMGVKIREEVIALLNDLSQGTEALKPKPKKQAKPKKQTKGNTKMEDKPNDQG